jgi:hypothetical protein
MPAHWYIGQPAGYREWHAWWIYIPVVTKLEKKRYVLGIASTKNL